MAELAALEELEDGEEEADMVVVCHGSPRCHLKNMECEYCYRFSSKDPRSTEQILIDMQLEQ